MDTKVSFLTKYLKPAVFYRIAGFGVALLLVSLPIHTARANDTTSSKKVSSAEPKKTETTEEVKDELETEEAIELTHEIATGKDHSSSTPSKKDPEESDDSDSASSVSETFDTKAAEAAMASVQPEVYPEGSPDANAGHVAYHVPKHGLSKLFEDKSALGIHSEASKNKNIADEGEDDEGVGIQSNTPHIAFESSNGVSEVPSLNDDITPVSNSKTVTNSSKSNKPSEAVPDVFSGNVNSRSNRSEPVASWLSEEGGSNENNNDPKNAWLTSLVPAGSQEFTDTNNSTNVVEWGSYETSGNAPSIALEAPVKPGQKPLPLYRPESLFSDPLGVNSWLRKRGIAFTLDNQNEFMGSVTKPTPGFPYLKQGSGNAGQVGFQSDVDWETLAGIKGFETHTLIVGRYGIVGSRSFGENLNNSSEIYGGGNNVVAHLAYAYGEESILNNRLRISAGRMPMLTFFAKNPLECTFMNNAFCGNPKTGNDVYTRVSSPNANWATKIVYYPTANTYIQAGLFFTENWNTNRSGFKFTGSRITGEAFPVEFGWNPIWGDYKGHYKIGIVPDDAPHIEGYKWSHASGNPISSPGFIPKKGHGEWGTWIMADQVILPHKTPANLSAGLVLMGGFWYNNPTYSTRKMEFEIGLLDTGFWKARPLDSIGVNFAWTKMSDWVGNYERAQINGLQSNPTAMAALNKKGVGMCGLKDGQAGFTCGVQTTSEVLEVQYKIHVRKGIYVSPDFQYFFHPGAQHVLKNTAMFGVKSHVQIF